MASTPFAQEIVRRTAAQSERDRTLDDYRVLSFRQWCELNGFSESTGLRLIRRNEGPVVTRLSTRRIGIRIADHSAWLASRARSGA